MDRLFNPFKDVQVAAARQRPLRARPAKAEEAASSLRAHSSLGRLMNIAHAGMCCRPCPSTLVGPRAQADAYARGPAWAARAKKSRRRIFSRVEIAS